MFGGLTYFFKFSGYKMVFVHYSIPWFISKENHDFSLNGVGLTQHDLSISSTKKKLKNNLKVNSSFSFEIKYFLGFLVIKWFWFIIQSHIIHIQKNHASSLKGVALTQHELSVSSAEKNKEIIWRWTQVLVWNKILF